MAICIASVAYICPIEYVSVSNSAFPSVHASRHIGEILVCKLACLIMYAKVYASVYTNVFTCTNMYANVYTMSILMCILFL